MPKPSRTNDLERIEAALKLALEVALRYTPGAVEWEEKSGGGRWDPVTEADEAIDELLREQLPLPDEGWLSEETRDDPSRLEKRRVWVVDPLDGTREFVQGVPEWCVSVGLVEDGRPVAGGIVNPATGQLVLGAEGEGVTLDGQPAGSGRRSSLQGAVVLASRSEVKRGEWDRFGNAPFKVKPCGSVAYKLGLVAAGLADATWTLVPKNEWDVVGGAALVLASDASVVHGDGSSPSFNRASPLLPNFLAGEPELLEEFRRNWL